MRATGVKSRAVGAKGDARRRQVIEAAARCFREQGFHGTSIAQISKQAGMSTGHIYHYFPTKEQIVEAIIDEEEGELAELIRRLDQQTGEGDFLSLVSAEVDALIERSLRPDYRSLILEIAAEGARNPKVAEMLRQSDRRLAARLVEMARERGGVAAASSGDEADLLARLEILPVLFAGLGLRSVQNAELDPGRMAGLVKIILTGIWSTRA